MALLTNGLSTIELGSISWRQVINQNFVYLDNNRIFVVEANANLPTSGFKNGRFFYSKATKSFWHDNGTLLTKVAGGTEINITGNPNKFIKINAAGTALEYVTITALSNNTTDSTTFSITEAGNNNNYLNAVALGWGAKTWNDAISIGYKSKLSSSTKTISIGNTNTINYADECIFIGNNVSYNTTLSYLINIGQELTGYNDGNISIGYNIDNSIKRDSHNFGWNIVSRNSKSFNIRPSNIQKSNLLFKGNSNYNYSTLTKIGVPNLNSLEDIEFPSSCLYTIEYKIIFLDTTNFNIKQFSGKFIGYNGTSTNTKKLFTKNIDFEDSIYTTADINLVVGLNKLELYINTAGISTEVTCDFNIVYNK